MATQYSITEIRVLDGPRDAQMSSEGTVGVAYRKMYYPGIIQCFTLTGVYSGGLIGTHISPGQSPDSITELFNKITELGGKSCTKWYLIGNLLEHTKYRTAQEKGWTSIRAITADIKNRLDSNSPLFYLDTTYIKDEKDAADNVQSQDRSHNAGGTTITITLIGGKLKFYSSYYTASKIMTTGPTTYDHHHKEIVKGKFVRA